MKTQAAASMRLLVAGAVLVLAATQAAAVCTNSPPFTPVNSQGWDCVGQNTQLGAVCSSKCNPGE
jgi:hypothetical protein